MRSAIMIVVGLMATDGTAGQSGAGGSGLHVGAAKGYGAAGGVVRGGQGGGPGVGGAGRTAGGWAGPPPQQGADRRPHVERLRLEGVRVVVEGLVLKVLPD